jgi:amino acid carrier protein
MSYEQLVKLINTINEFIASNILVWGLLGAGTFLSIKLGFPQIVRFGRSLKIIFGKKDKEEGSMSSFQALATSIAAQVGTGNVAGVATALTAGGPGSIFWMWVTAFLGMGTIFTEASLAQKYRSRIDGDLVGGPAYYILYGLKEKAGGFAKFLSGFFSIAIILALGFMGNAVQSNSISFGIRGVKGLEHLNPLIIGIAVALLTGTIFIGGMGRIAKFAELVVPVMALTYILGSIIILLLNFSHIIPTFAWIIKSAFTPTAAVGGIMGAVVRDAVQKGVARGVFTNEAGMGSTPHAHAVANVKHPTEQALSAMFGVLVSLVICTSTALVVLVTEAYTKVDVDGKFLKGSQLTQVAFKSAFGEAGAILLALCIIFFAFTTIVGWYYFGESNIKLLFGKSAIWPYRIIVLLFVVMGALAEVDIVWSLADIFNSLMVLPNLIAIVWLSSEVKELLTDYNKKFEENDVYYDYKYK